MRGILAAVLLFCCAEARAQNFFAFPEAPAPGLVLDETRWQGAPEILTSEKGQPIARFPVRYGRLARLAQDIRFTAGPKQGELVLAAGALLYLTPVDGRFAVEEFWCAAPGSVLAEGYSPCFEAVRADGRTPSRFIKNKPGPLPDYDWEAVRYTASPLALKEAAEADPAPGLKLDAQLTDWGFAQAKLALELEGRQVALLEQPIKRGKVAFALFGSELVLTRQGKSLAAGWATPKTLLAAE